MSKIKDDKLLNNRNNLELDWFKELNKYKKEIIDLLDNLEE